MLTTFQDAVHHLLDYIGGNTTAEAVRDARRAAQAALRDLAVARRWSYLFKPGRLVTSAPQTTGSVAYTHTGGAYERMLTLTGATWPSWAKYGVVTIAGIAYEIEDRKSNTIITLTDTTNPGADIAAGTGYAIYRDTYPMPADFIASDALTTYSSWGGLRYVHPSSWLESRVRLNSSSSGYPLTYTFTGDPDTLDRTAIRFHPFPENQYSIDFMYHRRPRGLAIFEYKDGTVATTSGSTAVAGTGTSWNSTHIGAVVRIKATSPAAATGVAEAGPYGFDRDAYYVHERRITDITNGTSLTVDSPLTETLSGAKYVISEPVDIQGDAMLNAYLRGCERQVSFIRKLDKKGDAQALYHEALILAKEADSRTFEPRRATGGFPTRGIYHLPLGPDA